jgi:predicted RND superfamily exporter protein
MDLGFMGFVQRRLVKLVIRVVSYPKLTLGICALILVGAVVLAKTRLRLSTDQDELLTPKLEFFREYKVFTRKFPENDAFVVLVEPRDYRHPPPASRWMDFADRLSAGLLALKGDVTRVEQRVPLEQLGNQAMEFADWDELKNASAQVKDFARLARILGEPPGIESLVLGRDPVQRFYSAIANGPARDSSPIALLITRSLSAALQRDPGAPTPNSLAPHWRTGIEIPNLNDADPRAASDPSIHGYNMIPNELKKGTPAYTREKLLAINVYTDRDYSSLSELTQPLERMRNVVANVTKDFPEFNTPVITGRPALDADEMATSDHDTRIAEILGLSVVFVVMFLFLRNLWLVVVAELCLGVGIGWTFGYATLAVGRLNLLSLVFVIALIGIGMDYLIQILTRYRFEKRRYNRPQAVWARVFRYVSAPISTACAGAAGAFFVSTLTNFQGAAELGIIAGGGLLLVLAGGYTLMPALLTLFPAKVGKVPVSRRYRLRGRHPRAGGVRLMPALLWILISVGGLWVSLPPSFDPNLLRLQSEELPSVREVRKINTWSSAVMSQDLDKLRRIREAETPAPGEPSAIERTESILDAVEKQQWLVANNAAALKVNWAQPEPPKVGDLHAISDAAAALVTAWEKQPDPGDLTPLRAAVTDLRKALEDGGGEGAAEGINQMVKVDRLARWERILLAILRENLEQFAPGEVDIARLPRTLRDHLVSMPAKAEAAGGGKPTYVLYVYPKKDLWEGGALQAFVKEVETRAARAGVRDGVLVTGIAPELFYSTQEIHSAFLKSTVYALLLIFLLVLLDLRKIGQTLLAISVLAMGLPMLLLAMWAWRKMGEPLGIPGSWNFANFFALPILIGAGHEYGVFMVHRYRETLHDPRRVWRTWDVSDRALLLCGIVTSASFGFLIAAKHHGLASLGWVMAVGTACIYLATLLVLRPILLWRLKHKGVYHRVPGLREWIHPN